jgi:mono/diheme cytochrome c family protein
MESIMRRLMACWGIALIAAAVFPLTTSGQRRLDAGEVSFSKHVAPIVYANCAYCHRPGEVAPFSLLTFKDARPWARAIKQAVVKKSMPPWRADPHYGQFRNARTLTDRQIETIAAWVDGGAKEGNPADLPPQPKFADGWQIGVPDLVLEMKEPVTIQATGTIPYMTVPTDYVFPEDTWIQAIEVRPGNRRVVHHAVASADYPGEAPGSGNVHLYAPGLEAMIFREGYGKFFPKGTSISFSMHYNAVGVETSDRSKIGFKFATKPVHTQVNTIIIGNNTFEIPPMVERHEVVGAFQFPTEARIQGLRPHMHLRGRLSTASLVMPDGARRVLLHVPDWDDSWQNYYVLSQPVPVPKGAILEYLASFNNSPANALNPDPKVPVRNGQQVWEEMHNIYMTWTALNEHNRHDDAPIQISPKELFTTGVTGTR